MDERQMGTHFCLHSHTYSSCILAGTKYIVSVHRRASDTFSLTLGRSSVDAVIRTLNDGGLLVQASMLHCNASNLPKHLLANFVA